MLSSIIPETYIAGSLLLYRLLRGYPPERLCCIGPAPHPRSRLLEATYHALPPPKADRLNVTRLAPLKRSLENLGLAGRVALRSVSEAIRAFRPEVVLTVMDRMNYSEAALSVSRQLHIPLVLIVHDAVERFEICYRWATGFQRRRCARLYRAAKTRLCINPRHGRILSGAISGCGEVLYPNRSEDLSPRPFQECALLKRPGVITVAYAGTICYGYGDALLELLPALSRAGVRLRVFGRDNPNWNQPGWEYAGFCLQPEETWAQIKATCDAVILPYSWDDWHRVLYSTHFPSKLPEYLALGMPVVISGPAYAAGVAWGLRTRRRP